MSDEYTPEELENLPQTSTILVKPELDMQAHKWIQSGYHLIDQCCDGREVSIPYGKMLVRKDGVYDLIDE